MATNLKFLLRKWPKYIIDCRQSWQIFSKNIFLKWIKTLLWHKVTTVTNQNPTIRTKEYFVFSLIESTPMGWCTLHAVKNKLDVKNFKLKSFWQYIINNILVTLMNIKRVILISQSYLFKLCSGCSMWFLIKVNMWEIVTSLCSFV